MADAPKNTPGEEVKKLNADGSPAVDAPKGEGDKEPTVGAIAAKAGGDKEPKAPVAETVGLDKFLDLKKENKELKQAIKDIEKKLNEGDDVEDVADDIEALADEFGVDKKFLKKLEGAISKKYGGKPASTDENVDSRLKALEARENADKINSAFKTHFDKAMTNLPEYEGVVNPEVIKNLSLLPQNANKTFTQIIEDTYGSSVVGKKTIETTRPRGGKEPEEIDFARASKDSKYFNEIMADPAMKKKYNENIEKRIPL